MFLTQLCVVCIRPGGTAWGWFYMLESFMVWNFPLLLLKQSHILEYFAFYVFGNVQPAIPNNWITWTPSLCLLYLVGIVTDKPFSKVSLPCGSKGWFPLSASMAVLLKPAREACVCSWCRFPTRRQVALLSNTGALCSVSLGAQLSFTGLR